MEISYVVQPFLWMVFMVSVFEGLVLISIYNYMTSVTSYASCIYAIGFSWARLVEEALQVLRPCSSGGT